MGWDPKKGYGGVTKYWGIQVGDFFQNTKTGKRFICQSIGTGDDLTAIDEDGMVHEYANLRLIARKF